MPGIDETSNFFRVRLRDPGQFTRLRQTDFKRGKPRIFAIVGRLRGENTTTLQSLLFPKEDGWTRERVSSWMDAHPDVGKAIAVEEVAGKDLTAAGVEPVPEGAADLWEQLAKSVPADGAVVRKTYAGQVKEVFEDDGEVDVVISTAAIDRDREVVRPDGMKVPKPRRIPLVASHSYGDLRKHIGEILRPKAEGEEVHARARYFAGMGNEEADWGFTLVKLRVPAYSIGFRALKIETADLDDEKVLEQVRAGKVAIRTFTEWELLEVSHVIVPSNREAVMRGEVEEAVAKGVIDATLADRIGKALQEAAKPAPEPPARDPAAEEAAFLAELLGMEREAAGEHYELGLKQGERWVANGARGLPLLDDDAWDAAAAVAAWRRFTGAVSQDALKDRGVQRRYRRGFLAHDAAAPESFGSYKFPFVKVDGGRAKASRRGLVAARTVLSGGRNRPDMPMPTMAACERMVNGYLGKPEDEGKGILPAQVTLLVQMFERETPTDQVVVVDEDGQAVFRGAPCELVDLVEAARGGPSEVRLAVALQVQPVPVTVDDALRGWAEGFLKDFRRATDEMQEAIEDALRKAAPNIPPDSVAALTRKDLGEIIVGTARSVALQVVAKAAGDPAAYR